MPGLDDLIPEGWRRDGERSDAPPPPASDAPADGPVADAGARGAEPAAPSEEPATAPVGDEATAPREDPALAPLAGTSKGAGSKAEGSEVDSSKVVGSEAAASKADSSKADSAEVDSSKVDSAEVVDGPEQGAPPVRAVRREVRRFLELFGITGLVVAQPLLEIYGKAPDVLVNARLSSLTTFLFGALLVFVPPVVLWLVTWPLVLISAHVESIAHRVVLAVLVGLFVAELVNNSGLVVVAWIVGIAAVVGMFVALARWRSVQSWLRYLSPAPIAFLALFLFASGASPLIFGGQGASASGVTIAKPRPVVFVLFDELPLVTLLDGTGKIDAQRFPAFAELAQGSSWFRNATTPATFTTQAVPSILTGKIARDPLAPVYATYPDNLFTMLAGQYRMNVMENVTALCPSSQCTRFSGETTDLGGLLSGAGANWVERFGEKQQKNAGQPNGAIQFDEFVVDHRPGRFDQFIDQIQPESGSPSLNFIHAVVPHFPWEFTPNGFEYTYTDPTGSVGGTWSDRQSADFGRSRHILQAEYTDRQLGRIISRLKEVGDWDDAVVVVTADHGFGFQVGESLRGVGAANVPELLWVPLFVRAPELPAGTVNDTPVSTVDVLPTVADLLGAAVPWTTDGVSALAGGSVEGDVRKVAPNPANTAAPSDDGFVHVAGAPQFGRVLAWPKVGVGTDDLALFRQGPFANYIGQPAPNKAQETSNTFFAIQSPRTSFEVDPSSGRLPIEVHGFLNGSPPEQWVAISLNGVIVGLVRTNLANEFFWVLPDTRFAPGTNSLDLFLVTGEPGATTLRNLPIQVLDK
ncbi:MAG: sulfatase-like hydrolase/transferase [Acidimicrobiales bacterium]